MKLIVIGDMHIGARNASKVFNEYFILSFNNFIFPLMEQLGIKQILQLGDLFDVRKTTSNYILNEFKARFFDKLQLDGYTFHTLAGNHDLYWRESLDVVTQNLVLNEYDNVKVYTKPTTITIDNTNIDIIPWICSENQTEVFTHIKESKSDLCIGHFEFSGFSMYAGHESKEGLANTEFEKYERVLSGHYHTKSTQGNITYTGVPYEMTWQDFNDPKGVYVFDTDTRELTFYENPNKMFCRLEYNDEINKDYDFEALTGKYVRIVVVKKTDLYNFELFLQRVNLANPIEIKIVEDLSEFTNGDIDDTINLEDTNTLLCNYIDNLDADINKEELKSYMRTLYTESVNISV